MKIPNISKGLREELAVIANVNTMGTEESQKEKLVQSAFSRNICRRTGSLLREPDLVKVHEGNGFTCWRLSS